MMIGAPSSRSAGQPSFQPRMDTNFKDTHGIEPSGGASQFLAVFSQSRFLSPHPYPLPKEREQPTRPQSTKDARRAEVRSWSLPLPKGPGEGERAGHISDGCKILRCARRPSLGGRDFALRSPGFEGRDARGARTAHPLAFAVAPSGSSALLSYGPFVLFGQLSSRRVGDRRSGSVRVHSCHSCLPSVVSRPRGSSAGHR
jgi:hypothetical protein